MIRFSASDHSYLSTDPENQVDWIGISHLISFFKPEFDPVASAVKCSRNPKSKWFGMDPIKIRSIWKQESRRSLDMGHWYHHRTEAKISSDGLFKEDGNTLKVIKPVFIGEEKCASPQILEEGHIYPEHLIYLLSEGICGQTDRVEVTNSLVNIRDYKTSKTIKTEGFRNWEGITTRMKEPLSHLDDCNMVHYSLQLSLYLYMVLKHNPQFKPGLLTLDHIIFEVESEDKYGYPIHSTDSEGNYIIKEIKSYKIPYLKTEVVSILNYLRENRELVKSKIKRED